MKYFIFVIITTLVFADNWNQFRGNNYSGVVENNKIPISWNKSNIIWSCTIAGKGGSSPIVWDDKAYITTAVALEQTNTNNIEPAKYNSYCEVHKIKQSRLLYCINATNGNIIWKKELSCDIPSQPIHPKNSFAAETPLTDGERVYAYFGSLALFCCDTNGNLLWKYNAGSYRMDWDWGASASPTIYDGKIILVNDNEEQSYIVVLDAKTGKVIWKKDREQKSCWSPPIVWKNFHRTEIVVFSDTGNRMKVKKLDGKVFSYDMNGNVLWEMQGMSPSTICAPIIDGDTLFICSGNNTVSTRPIYAVKSGANGDITCTNEDKNKYVMWKQLKASPHVPTPISYKHKLFVVSDEGKFACYDNKDGKLLATNRMRGLFTASPIAFNNYVFFLNEAGIMYGMNSETFKIDYTNTLNDYCLTTPAIANNSIYIRGANKLYCIKKEK